MPSLTGIIKQRQFSSGNGGYALTYALWLPNRLLINVVYAFSEAEREVWLNYRDSLDEDMTVEMIVDVIPTPERRTYNGQGAIRLMDDGIESPWFPVAEEVFSSNPDDSRRFSRSEQGEIWALLNEAKETLREQFDPDNEQAESIDQRLDTLAADLPKISVFSWKKLFVECVVGIAADLGFGSTVPETLINLFKKLFEAYLSHRIATGPNHALQRTAPCVTAPASGLRLSPTTQRSRQPRGSLSLGSLGALAHLPREQCVRESVPSSKR